MAKTGKKSPTIFYWLSLVCAAATIVMMFLNWFTFQATSFGNDNALGSYSLMKIEDFLITTSQYVPVDSNTWITTAAVVAMWAVVAVQAVYILWALITMRRTPPRGILPAVVSLVVGFGFLIAHAMFGSYIQNNLENEFIHIEFYTSVFPYIVIMLAVATVVFALLNRQESRALYAVKHPRGFVFPPENPEVV